MASIPLPADFIKNMTLRLGSEVAEFFQSLETKAPVSLRINPAKSFGHPYIDKVEWCDEGYYLPERPRFGSDPLFHAGCYYVQEAGSMFVGKIFEQVQSILANNEGLRVLDLCASPGG